MAGDKSFDMWAQSILNSIENLHKDVRDLSKKTDKMVTKDDLKEMKKDVTTLMSFKTKVYAVGGTLVGINGFI